MDETLLLQGLVFQHGHGLAQLVFPLFQRMDVMGAHHHPCDISTFVPGGQVGLLDMARTYARKIDHGFEVHLLATERTIEMGFDRVLEKIFTCQFRHAFAHDILGISGPVAQVGLVDIAVDIAGVHE